MEMERHFLVYLKICSVLNPFNMERVAQTVIFVCAIYLCKVGGDCGASPTLVLVFISQRIQETSVDRYFFISSLN